MTVRLDKILELQTAACLITETNVTQPPPEPVDPTEGSTGDDMAVTCRPACSVEFCSEQETKKRRICSAAGYDHVFGRDFQ